jgi:hypothetical protein
MGQVCARARVRAREMWDGLGLPAGGRHPQPSRPHPRCMPAAGAAAHRPRRHAVGAACGGGGEKVVSVAAPRAPPPPPLHMVPRPSAPQSGARAEANRMNPTRSRRTLAAAAVQCGGAGGRGCGHRCGSRRQHRQRAADLWPAFVDWISPTRSPLTRQRGRSHPTSCGRRSIRTQAACRLAHLIDEIPFPATF